MLVKTAKCEYCGGTKYKKDNGLFVCLGCSKKYTLEEFEKLPMVEVVKEDAPAERMEQPKKSDNGIDMEGLIQCLDELMEKKYDNAFHFERTLVVKGVYQKIAETTKAVGSKIGPDEYSKVMEEFFKEEFLRRINIILRSFYAKEFNSFIGQKGAADADERLKVEYCRKTHEIAEVYKMIVMRMEGNVSLFLWNSFADFGIEAMQEAIRIKQNVAQNLMDKKYASLFKRDFEDYNNVIKAIEERKDLVLKFREKPDAETMKKLSSYSVFSVTNVRLNWFENANVSDITNNTTTNNPATNNATQGNGTANNTAPKSTVNSNPANKKATGKQGCLVVVMAIVILAAVCLFI